MAAEHADIHGIQEIPARGPDGHDAHDAHAPNPLSPDAQMVIWTWVTFAAVAALLHRVAWKPILGALDARENRIRQSLEDAEHVRQAVGRLDDTRRRMLDETRADCKTMIAQARESAQEAAAQLEHKAQDRALVLYENAERDIAAMRNRVIAELRREEANLVVQVAGKLIDANLDDQKNRALADKLIAEF
jgi:F-type H+-transporting ATPase subunit b